MLLVWACTASAAGPARPVPDALPAAASAFEEAFSARAGNPLRQFGYDQFGERTAGRTGTGGVQGDYVLGPGDELLVTLRGQNSTNKRYTVDSAGLLIIDDLRPIAAQGLTLTQLRVELSEAVAAAHPNTEAYATITEVRRIGILVTGAVANPGRHEIGAFSTMMDALAAAGGVTRSGSLRRIRLLRPGAADGARAVDLYDLLVNGGGADTEIRLRDGDRLFVPPLGPTLAVTGPVKRPGIYELPPDRPSLSATEARELAGGALRPGGHRALRFTIAPTGEERTEEIADQDARLLGDGDLLILSPLREDRRGEIRLDGHVLRPGPRALDRTRTLDALVAAADLGPEPYLPFAVLARTDPATRARLLRPVDLAAVLNGRDSRRLAEGDTLHVLGTEDVDFLTSEPVLALLRGDGPPPGGACRGLVVLARALAARPDGTLARGPQARAAATLSGINVPSWAGGGCPPLFDAVPDLLVFALEHSTLVLDKGAPPGFRPTAGGAPTPAQGGAASSGSAPGAILESDEPGYELLGHVRRPGVRALGGGTTLRDALAGGDGLKRDVYPLLGVIERFDRRTLGRTLIAFSPREVTAGRANRVLADGDRVHLFPAARVRALATAAASDSAPGSPPSPSVPPPPGDDSMDSAVAALLTERVVQVRGAVRAPGAYPVADAAPLEALITAAGGLTTTADPAAVEVTASNGTRRRADLTTADAKRQIAGPGDAVRVNPAPQTLEAHAVTIAGAVRRPGSYDVGRGETLSSLIDRAGGLTEEAYPHGAVFTRESERRRQKDRLTEQALQLERDLALELGKGDPVKAEKVAHFRQLAALLRGMDPPGRIVVEADPAILRTRPELDVLLESDDRVTIPKRPLTVEVAGEVMHAASVQFVSGKSAEDYLREAGGPTRNADPDRAYLILPDGSTRPLFLSSWNHTVGAIPPGSTIVVPLDPKPFDVLEFSKGIGGILGQIAITAASVSVIGR